ncbi:MAG: fluoride efflux transporter CrcB [Flavobacterium sp.]|nr:fluoride efflux transporter CrcB [Flavobacterium sp.]
MRTLLLIGLGGSIGSILRYLTSVVIEKYYATIFPLPTLIINILGCLLIGIIMGLLEKNQANDSAMKWFLVTGFCGGFTTFSAFGYENIRLLQNGNIFLALVYISTSIILGLGSVWLGFLLVK